MTEVLAIAADLTIANDADQNIAPAAPKKARKAAAPRARKVKPVETVAVEQAETKAALKGIRKLRKGVVKYGFYGVVAGEVVLTALSLSHLAQGIAIITHNSASAGVADFAFASTFDVMMLVVKVLLIMIPVQTGTEELHKYGNIFVTGALIASAGLNSLAFAHEAVGFMIYPAIAFGISIPAMLFGLTKIAAKTFLYLNKA